MLKRFLIFLSLVLFCSSCTVKNSQEVLTFSSWGSATERKILNNIIDSFEKENPDIRVKFLHIPQNYFQKIHLLFASNTAPDVIFINNLFLPVYSNYLIDLTNILNLDDYYIQAINALCIENKLFAVPRDISNFVFFVNTDIAGNINHNWTFNDFISILEKNKKQNCFAVSFEPDIMFASPYILTLGNDNGIAFYKNLEGKYAPAKSDSGSFTQAQMFLDGKIVLYLSGRWMYPIIKEKANFNFQVLPFPGITEADASGWGISKNSKHKTASIKFVRYLSSKQSIEYFTTTGLIVPARKDVSYLLENSEEEPFLMAVKKSKNVKYDKNYNKIRDKINRELFK